VNAIDMFHYRQESRPKRLEILSSKVFQEQLNLIIEVNINNVSLKLALKKF
jgi:hypothetical protein